MTYGIMQYLIQMTYDATLNHLDDKTTFDWLQWWSLAVAHSHWATWFSSERLGNPKDSLNERIEKNANFGRIEKTALISTHTAFIVP